MRIYKSRPRPKTVSLYLYRWADGEIAVGRTFQERDLKYMQFAHGALVEKRLLSKETKE